TSWKRNLIEDFTRRSKRLDKDCFTIRNGTRDDVKVCFRQCQKLAKCSRMSNEAQNFSCWTMPAKTTLAPLAALACEIDFTDHAMSTQTLVICIDDLADKFMPGRS